MSYVMGFVISHDDPAYGTRKYVMFVNEAMMGTDIPTVDDDFLPCRGTGLVGAYDPRFRAADVARSFRTSVAALLLIRIRA